MSGNLMCVKHPTRDAYVKVAFLGEFRCIECVREIGDFDEFGPLSKFSQKREDAKKTKESAGTAAQPQTAQSAPEAVPRIQLPSEKKCSICGQVKPRNVFENDKRRPDGHGPRCKPCVKARAAAKKEAV